MKVYCTGPTLETHRLCRLVCVRPTCMLCCGRFKDVKVFLTASGAITGGAPTYCSRNGNAATTALQGAPFFVNCPEGLTGMKYLVLKWIDSGPRRLSVAEIQVYSTCECPGPCR